MQHRSLPPDLQAVPNNNVIQGPWVQPTPDELLQLGRDPSPLAQVLWGDRHEFLLGPPGPPKSMAVARLFPRRNWFQRRHTIDVWRITNGQFLAFCVVLSVILFIVEATKGWSWQ